MLQWPEPRGEVSERLLAEIGRDPHPIGEHDIPAPADPLADEDLQLALYACYELHYRGISGVSDEWEWEPTLPAARRQLEQRFLGALVDALGPPLVEIQADEYGGGDPERIHAVLFAQAMDELGLDSSYGAYLNHIPGYTLATVNLMSLLGLHRRPPSTTSTSRPTRCMRASPRWTSRVGSPAKIRAWRLMSCGGRARSWSSSAVSATTCSPPGRRAAARS